MADRERLQAEKMSVEARKARGRGVEPRFKSKRKNCRIKKQDSDSEGVLGGTAASSRHCADVRVRARQVEEMHAKDIRNSEE